MCVITGVSPRRTLGTYKKWFTKNTNTVDLFSIIYLLHLENILFVHFKSYFGIARYSYGKYKYFHDKIRLIIILYMSAHIIGTTTQWRTLDFIFLRLKIKKHCSVSDFLLFYWYHYFQIYMRFYTRFRRDYDPAIPFPSTCAAAAVVTAQFKQNYIILCIVYIQSNSIHTNVIYYVRYII